MFYRYEIKNNGTEDILYLYLTMTYEFSKELDSHNNNKQISRRCKNFINNNSIDFKGNKVYLVINGIIVKTLDIDNKILPEENFEKKDYSNNNYIVNVKFKNDKIIEVRLKDYLLGVIATNSLNDLELTTLKALCLLYRTYVFKEMKEKNYIDAINEFFIYKPISYYKVIWINNYQYYYNKISKAIIDTDKEFLTYNNEYIKPFIHISNNGFTEKLNNYPYLEKRNSLWDYASPHYLEIKDYNYDELEKIFKLNKELINKIQILQLNESNHIEKIKVGEYSYTGKVFRKLLNLKSTDITIIINPTFIRFITKGWGDNLGLSQFGANEIAKTGYSYTNILKYYFPKIQIKKYK